MTSVVTTADGTSKCIPNSTHLETPVPSRQGQVEGSTVPSLETGGGSGPGRVTGRPTRFSLPVSSVTKGGVTRVMKDLPFYFPILWIVCTPRRETTHTPPPGRFLNRRGSYRKDSLTVPP